MFEFKSGKPGAHQNICKTHVFVMHVAEELDVWPEGSERKRIWVGGVCVCVYALNMLACRSSHVCALLSPHPCK